MYRVTFYVQTPIIFQEPLHFDALLAAVHPGMRNGGTIINRGTSTEILRVPPLPLDSIKLEKEWQWCCSAMEMPKDAVPIGDTIYRKKNLQDDLYAGARQLKTIGWQKNFMKQITGYSCSCVWFDFSSCYIEQINRLLKRINYVGSHRNKGYGKVINYEIKEIKDGWETCVIKDGIARRNLQSALVESEYITPVNIRVPYWHSSSAAPGVSVGTVCGLKDGVYLNAQLK